MRDDLDPARWTPNAIRRQVGPRPEPGDLIGHKYAAWRVVEVNPVTDADLNEQQRHNMALRKPGYQELCRPYYLVLAHTNGPILARVQVLDDGTKTLHVAVDRPDWTRVHIMPERYQTCSCHGHPWPCQGEMQDRVAARGVAAMEALASKVPGCCWCCNEPITHRQHTVDYPGDNVDLPGGPSVRFHLRRSCYYSATQYELRWLAVDPRRERVLTWPRCGGILVIHADGSSECRPWSSPQLTIASAPDCGGHLTHDHGTRSACFCVDDNPCPRGCSREGHPGVTTPRPARQPAGQATIEEAA